MNIKWWVGLPWKIREVLGSVRRDLADSRRMIAELLPMIPALREMLAGEIREQGIIMEAAARSSLRAAAEMQLRKKLTPTLSREEGVSVLITCWNHAGVLGLAVASAIDAIESLSVPGEVIILDDGSRDGSREIAQELARANEKIQFIPSAENLGLPRARNVLLSQARFKHAMILDSDNQLVPSGVAVLYAAARQTGAVLAYGNILQVDQSGGVLGVVSNERVTANLLKENWIDAMVMVRTDRLVELGGYDSEWSALEDWELNQRLFALGEPMAFVPALVGKYTTLPLSMSREAPLSSRHRRSLRIFGSLDASDSARYRACIYHPDLGTLWTSAGWSSPPPAPQCTRHAPRDDCPHAEREDHTTEMVQAVPRRSPARLKVLVVASGGVCNYGDDAILLSTLQRLQRIRPGCLASVVSDGTSCPPLGRLAAWTGTCGELVASLHADDVRRGCRDHLAIAGELSRRLKFDSSEKGDGVNLCETRATDINVGAPVRQIHPVPFFDMQSFDMVHFAGGGNLNTYWPELIAWRAAIAAAANTAGVPYILSGQGVGPVSAEIAPMLAFLVGGASAVATRDSDSLRLLKQIVPNGPRMNMVGDDALGLLSDGPMVARKHLANVGVPSDRPLLGFQAREALYVGFSREELKDHARQVDEFAAANGYVVVAVPTNSQSPAPEVELLADLAYGKRRRAEWHLVNHGSDVAAITGVIKLCSAFLTHSYHSALFALENRIATLLFARTAYYHLKGEALCAAFGIPVPIIAGPKMADGAIAEKLEKISQLSWSRGMTSADVDAWLDKALPREGRCAAKTSIMRLDRAAWGMAG